MWLNPHPGPRGNKGTLQGMEKCCPSLYLCECWCSCSLNQIRKLIWLQLTNLLRGNLTRVKSQPCSPPFLCRLGSTCERNHWGPGAAAGLAPLLGTAPPASSSLSHGNGRERRKRIKNKKRNRAYWRIFLCSLWPYRIFKSAYLFIFKSGQLRTAFGTLLVLYRTLWVLS